MTAKRLSLPSLSAILFGSFTLWVSFGTLAVTAADAGRFRVAVLPSPWWLLATLAVVSLLAIVARDSRVRLLWLSVVVLLPWLPVPVPAAAYMWTGPLRWAVWTAIAAAAVAPAARAAIPAATRRLGTDPGRAPYLAAAIAAIVYLLAARQIAPRLPVGDEPHYVVIAQSLLRDGDLQIENNHLRGDYYEFYPRPLKPDYLARGVNGEIYSVHAPGLPAVIAPVFAAFGYPGVLGDVARAAAGVDGRRVAHAWADGIGRGDGGAVGRVDAECRAAADAGDSRATPSSRDRWQRPAAGAALRSTGARERAGGAAAAARVHADPSGRTR
jgi:hypothetical protein